MQALLDRRTLKEAAAFAGAAVGLYVVGSCSRPRGRDEFTAFPKLQLSAIAPRLQPLARIAEPALFEQVCRMGEDLLAAAEVGRGEAAFQANRLSAVLLEKVRALLDRAARSSDHETCIRALDFQKDELGPLEQALDDCLRNMLLDAMEESGAIR